MSDSKYDEISSFYLNFVQHGLENSSSVFHMAINAIFELSGDLSGKSVCDLACGEGYLSRMLAERGAVVFGIDISPKLLEYAKQKSEHQAVTYLHDDAQVLEKVDDHSVDMVICNLALMDIPDIRSTIQAVHRALKKEGWFLFTILHPCFETPFSETEHPVEIDDQGT